MYMFRVFSLSMVSYSSLSVLASFITRTAKPMAALQRDWNLCVCAVDLEKGPIYFCSEDVPAKNAKIKQQAGKLSEAFPWKLSFALTAYNPGDVVQSNVNNAVAYEQLKKELKTHRADAMTSFAFFPDDPTHFERGFLILSSEDTATSTEQYVAEVARKYKQAGYFQYETKAGRVHQKLISVPDGQLVSESSLVQVVPPPCHPVFTEPSLHSVYHHFSKVKSVLFKSMELAGVSELWKIASSFLDQGCLQADNPVIVIEGLDATGKSTLCEKLSKSIGATLLGTPPKCISHLRPTFDAHPPLIRRAYYVLSNYIAAQEVAEAVKAGPVVMDRFWHSSAAYAIATEVGCGGSVHLPPLGHEIYKWPQDLTRPHIVILLVTTPEVRQSRIRARGKQMTDEERHLETNTLFEERVLESYKRMSEPAPQLVDTSGTPEEVLEAVMNILDMKGIH